MTTTALNNLLDARGKVLAPAAASPTPRSKSLSELVLAVVQQAPEGDLAPVSDPRAGIAFQPRSLLAVLTYCYAKGIYASQEIETLMRRDAMFRRCCANEFPGWRTLRRFRKKNRHMLQHCLAATLAEAEPVGKWAEATFAQEAATRIENAMLMDMMNDDGQE